METQIIRQFNIKKNLIFRAKVLETIRAFFSEYQYLEVETPLRIPAPAPELHIEAQPSGVHFLQTSPELCMKQLLSAGYDRIYQICKCFRQNEHGSRHLPEFTMLEWYRTHITYLEMMEESERLITYILKSLGFDQSISYQEKQIHFETHWLRLTVEDAFHQYASITMKQALLENSFDEIMALEIESNLGNDQPVFLYDYPIEKCVLTHVKSDNKYLAERFELYIGGIELCNGCSELNNPEIQAIRFNEELTNRALAGKIKYPLPQKYLEALHYMPKASGNALGIDRLVMLLANTTNINDVVAFIPEEL